MVSSPLPSVRPEPNLSMFTPRERSCPDLSKRLPRVSNLSLLKLVPRHRNQSAFVH